MTFLKAIIAIFFYFIFFTNVSNSECIEGDCSNGFGKYLFDGADTYEGYYANNYPNGFGKFTFADGAIQDGEWVDGSLHGKGAFYSKTKTGEVRSYYYKYSKIGKEIDKTKDREVYNFRSIPGVYSGDTAIYDIDENGNITKITLMDTFENTFFYKPDGGIILDQDRKSEIIDRWLYILSSI